MYHKKNERDMFVLFGGWCFAGFMIFVVCIIYCQTLLEIIVCLLFVLLLIMIGIKGIRDIKKRQKEIQELISGNKYLIGYWEEFAIPKDVVFTCGFKCIKFLCISECGKEYHFQSEPFDTRKKVFSDKKRYKIYVDDLNFPKKHFVSDEVLDI